MYLCLNKLASKVSKKNCPNFLGVIFPFILGRFSFVNNAMNFFIHYLNRFVFLKVMLTRCWFSSIGCPKFKRVELMMASGRDNVSKTFKLQIFEVISTIRKNSKRADSKAIEEYVINNSASNINESFVVDTLRILMGQNTLFSRRFVLHL